jgi:hypothetical protein
MTEAFTDLSSVNPLVQPYAPLCPENVVLQKIALSASQFCLETEVWREMPTGLVTVEDQQDYPLAVPTGVSGVIKRIVDLWFVNTDDMNIEHKEYQRPGTYEFWPDNYTLHIIAPPTVSGMQMQVKIVIQPQTTCDVYPQWLMDRWRQVIADGALWMIADEVGLPWGNTALSASRQRKWLIGCGQAKADVITRYKNGNLVARYRRFF